MSLAATLLLALMPMSAENTAARDCVVLLHGLARSERSMRRMATSLEEAGYSVSNVGYPSRKHRIETLAPMAIDEGLARCGTGKTVHFVTHSLGGILVRYYNASNPIPRLGRVVMLGPPNQGSAAADKWRGFPGYRWLNGPAGAQLGKGEGSVPLALGPVNFELGVIAGDRSIDPLTSAMLENPDDGRVSVSDTRVEGMDDFRIVHASHAFMMRDREVIGLVKAFLRDGRFPPGDDDR